MSDSTVHRDIKFDRFELRPAARQLLVEGRPAKLGARAFDVLTALVQRRERVVSKDELLDVVWPGLVVEENNLHVHISSLRKLLGATVIGTVPGRGYRFTAMLRADAAVPNAGAASEAIPTLTDFERQGAAQDLAEPVDRVAVVHSQAWVKPGQALLGREADLSALAELLGSSRLVTLTGPAGIGKTSLARAVSQDRSKRYRDGVAWVDLAPLTDVALMLGSIRRALNLGLDERGDPLDTLLAMLGPCALLLVLDNAEHLAAAIAHVVEAIQDRAPEVHLLVTSQSVLRVRGEQTYRLGPLSVPEAVTPAPQALLHGAVALFAQRARSADRSFEVTQSNVDSIVDICRRLDGLPLAIELAAARVKVLGLRGLGGRLDERLRLLAGGPRTAPARQQTLHDAMDWSHALLSATEQMLFRRAGVFADGFSLELIEAVTRCDDTAPEAMDGCTLVDALGSLVDHSLVCVDDSDPPRYRLLESARLYALERLDSVADEAERVRSRHADAVRELFDRADLDWWRLGDTEWERRYGCELDNLRTAIDWCVARACSATGDSRAVATAVALIGSGSRLFFIRDMSLEESRRLELGHRLIDAQTPPPLAARLLRRRAAALARGGRRREGMPIARRALELARSTGSACETYQALWTFALCFRQPQTSESLTCCDEMAVFEQPDWPPKLLAVGKEAQAHALEARGQLREARTAREAHLELALVAQAERSAGYALFCLADLALALGDPHEAVRRGRELVDRSRALNHRLVQYIALKNLIAACLGAGDTALARRSAEEFVSLASSFNWEYVYLAADPFALLAAREGRWEAAARLVGYADHGYATQEAQRDSNDVATRKCAFDLLSDKLDETRLAALMSEGVRLNAPSACAAAVTTA